MNFEKIKLCRKSLPFACLAECTVNSDINNELFEMVREEILFSNLKIILNQM